MNVVRMQGAPPDRNLTRDDLVSLVYRGPLENPPWQGFLEALCRRLGCSNAGIVLRLSKEGTPPIAIWAKRPPVSEDDARNIRARHAELGHLDPLRNALASPGAIYTLDELLPRKEIEANRFYREVLVPYRFERMLGMYIAEPGGWEGNIGVTNDASQPDFTQADKDVLLDLRLHLEQSLALFARINHEQAELQALIETLDRLTIGTVILDAGGAVLRSNSVAKRMITRGDVLTLRNGRLSLIDRAANAEFAQILANAAACRNHRPAMPFVQAIKIETRTERHLGLLARSIVPENALGGDNGPALAVYIAGDDKPRPIERLVTQLFDLTPSEAHLATLLATGLSLSEAAEQLDLTENTVRTYCKSILNKVGVSRQTDLVRLILRSVAVLG